MNVEDLPAMSPAELRAAWRDKYRKAAPSIGPDLLRRGIAWRLQERIHGSLPVATRKVLDAALRRLEKTGGAITGAHWSGPRFFGLKKQKAPFKRGTSDG